MYFPMREPGLTGASVYDPARTPAGKTRMRRLSVAFPALAAAIVVGLGLAAWPYTVDDAFILGRYARRIAAGLGHTMIDGPPSDGVTGPLALVPGLVASALGFDPVDASKLVGLLAAACAAAMVVHAARRSSGGQVASTWALLLVAMGPTLPVWGVAGLETGLATWVATCAGLAAIGRSSHRGITIGLSLGALAWLRPEMAFFALALLVSVGIRDRTSALRAALIACALALSTLAYRALLFGELLPLALLAKPGEVAHGVGYVGRALMVACGLVGALPLLAPGARRSTRLLAPALGAHVVAVALAGGDWMPGFRLMAPVLPLYSLALALELTRWLRVRSRPRRGAAWACGVIALAVPALDLAVELPRVRDAGQTRERVAGPLAARLAERAQVVALVDVGYLAYRADFDVVDLGGITDPVVARLPGGHLDKRVGADLLEHRATDTLVLHSAQRPQVDGEGRLRRLAGWPVEQRIAALPWVREHFIVDQVVPYADHYWYVVLVRRDR